MRILALPRIGRVSLTAYGWGVLAPVLILCVVGLSCIYATEAGLDRSGEAFPRNTIKQAASMVLGLACMGLICSASYLHFGRLAYPGYWVAMGFLAVLVLARYVPLAPLIPEIRGSCRWIVIAGFQFQPSEFTKVAFVMALARYLRYRKNYRTFRGLIEPFLLTLLPMMLILLEPDLGTVILLLPVLFAMLFVAGAKKKHLAAIILMGLASMPVFYFFVMEGYQKTRIQVLLRQADDDPRWLMNQGYQLEHSKTALGSGGIAGEAFREGLLGGAYVRHRFLPDRHNDFIFSIVGHQWGMVGCLLVIGCYACLVMMGVEIATHTADPFGRLLAIGMSVMIATQAAVNIAMTMGLMPITGLTLPFVSFGANSILASFLAAGIMINVHQRRPVIFARKPFEYGDEDE